MPSFIFFDRDSNELGVVLDHPGWHVGDIMERKTGRYCVVEVIESNLPNMDGLTPIIVERVLDDEE